MAQDLKPGQFWRDTVNTDVLKILGFSFEPIEQTPATTVTEETYVRCACYPRGEYLMGTQEMKTSHLGTERFERVGPVKSLWYRIKFWFQELP